MASFRAGRGARKPYSRPPPRDVNAKWVHDQSPFGAEKGTAAADKLGSVNAPTNTKLVVSNLHYEVTPSDVGSIFGQVGTLVKEPLIRYDASGRSTGVAIVTFETPAEAEEAKRSFDGLKAKGQTMKVAFDTFRPATKRSVSDTASLLNRIQKPALKDRLSKDDGSIPHQKSSGPGPIRRPRGGGARGAPAGGRGARPPRAPKKPKTAEDLDKELDAFMGDSMENDNAAAGENGGGADVEMSA